MTQASDFEGFPLPTRNYFSLPNEMINIIASINNLAELKVIIYIIRHTWGYKEYGSSKPISTDEFMHGRRRRDGSRIDDGTGLSNRSVIDGLRAAVDHGYLICEGGDKPKTIKSYRLKMQPSCEESSQDTSDQSYEESSQASYETSSQDSTNLMKNLHIAYEESSQPSKKDTIERNLLEKNLEKNNVALATDTTISHPQKKTARKPKAIKKDIDPEISARVDAVFDCLDTLAQETSGNSDFTYSRTKKAKEDIKALLDGRTVSPEKMRLVYMEMWNAPTSKDGFSWKENMSIAAICRHYDQKLLAAMSKQKQTSQRSTLSQPASLPPLPKEASEPYRPKVIPSSKPRRPMTAEQRLQARQAKMEQQKGAVG